MKNNKEISKITLRMTPDEKRAIEEKAAKTKKSVNRYLIDTALGSGTVDRAEFFRQAQRLVHLQLQIDALADEVKKQDFRKECAAIWSGLKY